MKILSAVPVGYDLFQHSDIFSFNTDMWGFFSPLVFGIWDLRKKTLIMQHALMHNWLEHLTHTNIHISPVEEIPQGWDRAMCVWKTDHSTKKLVPTKGMTTFRWSITWFKSDIHVPLLMYELFDTRWCFSHRYKLVQCYVHTRVSEMLCWRTGLGNDTALRSLMERENQEGSSFLHWPPTTASTHRHHRFYSWV